MQGFDCIAKVHIEVCIDVRKGAGALMRRLASTEQGGIGDGDPSLGQWTEIFRE